MTPFPLLSHTPKTSECDNNRIGLSNYLMNGNMNTCGVTTYAQYPTMSLILIIYLYFLNDTTYKIKRKEYINESKQTEGWNTNLVLINSVIFMKYCFNVSPYFF